MSEVMDGVGLAHTLAEAFDHSQASSGLMRRWNNTHINALTTKDGKNRVLGPMLDVLRGDAIVVPRKRIIYTDAVKPGEKDSGSRDSSSIVLLNRFHCGNVRIPRQLILGEFKLGVASMEQTDFYERHKDEIALGRCEAKPETHIDVPSDPELVRLSRRHLLPTHLIGKKLPGIALRNFFMGNPHHIPECFSGIVLFWGTICKNDRCYYVPGIYPNGQAYGLRICTYRVIDGIDVLGELEFESSQHDAAVIIS